MEPPNKGQFGCGAFVFSIFGGCPLVGGSFKLLLIAISNYIPYSGYNYFEGINFRGFNFHGIGPFCSMHACNIKFAVLMFAVHA